MNSARKYYVYEWFIVDTNEVFYVGKGSGDRYRTRKRDLIGFNEKVNAFNCDSRIIKNGLTEQEAFDLEIETIAYYRNRGVKLLNILDGGKNPPLLKGVPKTDEWKKKIGESNKKLYEKYPEKRKENSRRLKEFLASPASEEFKRKSIESRKTDAFRKAQRERSVKALNTEEFHQRHSKLMKEINNRPEMKARHIGKNNVNAQGIKQYGADGTFIREYETITEASKETGCSISKISAVAKGRRKTTGGYRWEYSNDKKISFPNRKQSQKPSIPSNAQPVLQYDLCGNCIAVHESIAAAAKAIGKDRANIVANLHGRTKSAYGFVWKYE